MRKIVLVPVTVVSRVFFETASAQVNIPLAKTILADNRLDTTQARALRLLTGFAAETSYGEVWIRDFNTFIKGSLQVQPKGKVRFPNMKPYLYQNAGDWTCFGARIIQALVLKGFTKETRDELNPIIDRANKYKGFFEWYDV